MGNEIDSYTTDAGTVPWHVTGSTSVQSDSDHPPVGFMRMHRDAAVAGWNGSHSLYVHESPLSQACATPDDGRLPPM
jgi:hypothetical protein